MLVMLSGMVIDVRPLPQKALLPMLPMLVTLVGIIVFLHPIIRVFDAVSMMALQFSRESYIGLPSATEIEVRPLHSRYLQLVVYQFVSIKTVEK